MRAGLSLDDLLIAEDDAAVLDFRCPQTQILLWPLVRTVFVRMMLSDLLYATPLVKIESARANLPLSRAASTLSRSLYHNAVQHVSKRCRADICIMTDALGIRLVDGKWFNRLSDYFALSCPSQTLVVEDHFGWVWPQPRHFGRVIFHAPWQVANVLVGRIRVRDGHRQVAGSLIDLVSRRAKAALGWELGAQRHGQLTETLARKLAAAPYRFGAYQRMLENIAPKILLVDSGCYGPSTVLIAVARHMRIPTAEFQHGAISSGHDAYNLAPRLRASPDYRAALPDYFLAFGQWWGEQINVPVTKVVVGNPHRDAQVAQLGAITGPKRSVLLLGDGIETEKYFEFARSVAMALQGRGLQVIYRPHPLERKLAQQRWGEGTSEVTIDRNSDIYESLARAHIVISEQSSGLFEAIGLADKIFVWNTSKSQFGFPSHPFHCVDAASDLARLLDEPGAGEISAEGAKAIWAPDWRKNYHDFLRSCRLTPTGSEAGPWGRLH